MCALNKNHFLYDRTLCLVTLILGWANFVIFILTLLNYYKHFIHTDIHILPVAVINISGAVGLTLLIFCLSALRQAGSWMRVFWRVLPSLIVFIATLFFTVKHGEKWLLYFL